MKYVIPKMFVFLSFSETFKWLNFKIPYLVQAISRVPVYHHNGLHQTFLHVQNTYVCMLISSFSLSNTITVVSKQKEIVDRISSTKKTKQKQNLKLIQRENNFKNVKNPSIFNFFFFFYCTCRPKYVCMRM